MCQAVPLEGRARIVIACTIVLLCTAKGSVALFIHGMITKGQMECDEVEGLSVAEQLYALAS